MPFGLTGAPFAFQSVMNRIKSEVKAAIYCYLDDVVVVSESEETHLKDIAEFLQVMEMNGLKLRLDKCNFGKAQLKHLGFLISRDGIRPDPTNVENYFRRFIPNFAKIMACLHELTTRGEEVKKNWNETHENAFKTVIQKLVEAPVLVPPQFGRPFEIETDASKEAAGAVLYQRDNDNHLRPICYYSRKMNKHERQYSSIELEALAIVAALKEFRPYIEGSGTTIIRTDSSACCSLMKNKNLQGRLAKFQLAIMAFDIKFEHRAGVDNKFCDYLSRADIIKAIKFNVYPEDIEEKKLEMKMENLVMKNSALYFYNQEEADDIRLLIPYSLRERIIKEFHADATQGGHLGQLKTLEKMKKRVYWPFMVVDIKETIRGCATCQTAKVNPGDRVPEPLAPIEPPDYPFDRIHIDYFGSCCDVNG
uniref:RNA-directed DNA polymerase n=1 Tax=Panagrolaimus superbus TaxID=310955 RepID=A0A914Z967_9BILA